MSTLQPVPIPWPQRLDDLRRGPLALLLWCAAAAGAGMLLIRQEQRVQILGLARSLEAEISSEVDGLLVEVLVQPFEDVAAGQPIARLDDAHVAARIETARAEVLALESEIAAERARLARELAQAEEDRGIALRRLLLDEEEPRLERLQATVLVESDLIERARVELRLGRVEELVAQGLAPEAERDDLALQRDRLGARIEGTRAHLAALERAEAEVIARRVRFESEVRPAPGEEVELAPLRASVRAAQLLVEEIGVERRALTLSTPVAGRVTLLAATGQALLAGEPVATVIGLHADSIVAYLPAAGPRTARTAELSAGTRVLVQPLGAPERTAQAVVTRLGPAIEEVPAQLWSDPALPEFGRPVLIAGVSGLALTPGAVALIRPLDG